ncbi:MAG: prepilin-type N-terminal cleavage/methylation domain-containing protein, partial [Planctomycetales bacterium]|nr:prepilin-type N-terminal cleavage/methylation domain-containing protein [Planctomycetales bacterium]
MRRHETDRRGLSLVEVLLALAVLSVAMGLLGHLIRLGGRQATAAHQTTQAQLHAQSIMAQVVGR